VSKAADGKSAEDLAAAFLARQGLAMVERNYRCRVGEIDLIMQDGDTLVFAEVRLRRADPSGGGFGGAAASVTPAKQARIAAAARHYLAGGAERPCRFDVVLLDRLAVDAIEWIRDAFGE
jgi:putative endonuclease